MSENDPLVVEVRKLRKLLSQLIWSVWLGGVVYVAISLAYHH